MQLSTWNVRSDVRVIRILASDLNGSNAGHVRERVLEEMEGCRHAILDLEEVSTIDDSGLAALLELRMRAGAQRRNLIVCRLAAQPALAFQLLRLNTRFHLSDHLEEALRSCGVTFLAPVSQLEAI